MDRSTKHTIRIRKILWPIFWSALPPPTTTIRLPTSLRLRRASPPRLTPKGHRFFFPNRRIFPLLFLCPDNLAKWPARFPDYAKNPARSFARPADPIFFAVLLY